MKKLFIVILVVAVFALSCGRVSQDTDLRLMLSEIPSELAANNILWFSDMERMKDLAGVAPDADANEFIHVTGAEYQHRLAILAGYTLSDFDGGVHLEEWQDAFGFDIFDISQELWGSQVEPNGTRSLFSVMKGDFNKNNIIEKLENLGYQYKNYASIGYYAINADYQVGDIESSRAALMALSFLNRMMVEEQEIIAAPADDIFFPVLDVSSDRENSLEGSLSYTRVAEALGDVLGAALVPRSVLRSENVGGDWDKLHSYDLAGIGYRVEGQDREIVIVLHYPDNSAANDIDELNRRMAEYVVTTGNLDTPLLSDLFSIGEPEVTTYGPDSILKVEFEYKTDTPGTLWSALVQFQDLGFLVSNPSE